MCVLPASQRGRRRRRRRGEEGGRRRRRRGNVERERSDTMRGKEGRLVSVRNAASEREIKECVPQCKSCPLRPEIFS